MKIQLIVIGIVTLGEFVIKLFCNKKKRFWVTKFIFEDEKTHSAT